MIKISKRPNLIYPLYLILCTFLRKIISIILSKIYKFKNSVIYTFLMFIGEIIGGVFFYLYQKGYFEKKIKISMPKESKLNNYLITNQAVMTTPDSNIKKIFLIILTAFFDFSEFLLSTHYINKIPKISGTLQIRLGGFLIVISSLICRFTLKIKIFKHQIVSVSIIGICLLILIISEFLFQTFDMILNIKNLFFAILFSILSHFFIAFNNTIEKYMIDINFFNPFKFLFMQGVIGLIFITIFSIFEEPISELKNIYIGNSTGMFTLFIFLLLFYTIFGMFKNIYRMVTIMFFSPMNKHLSDIIINPIYIIYYFAVGEDFVNNKGKNYFYFFLNLILLILFDFFGLIYNEFLIINCCGLDYNTYNSISFRAYELEEMEKINESEDDDISFR